MDGDDDDDDGDDDGDDDDDDADDDDDDDDDGRLLSGSKCSENSFRIWLASSPAFGREPRVSPAWRKAQATAPKRRLRRGGPGETRGHVRRLLTAAQEAWPASPQATAPVPLPSCAGPGETRGHVRRLLAAAFSA